MLVTIKRPTTLDLTELTKLWANALPEVQARTAIEIGQRVVTIAYTKDIGATDKLSFWGREEDGNLLQLARHKPIVVFAGDIVIYSIDWRGW